MYKEINQQLAALKEKGRIYEKWTKRLEKLQTEESEWEAKVKRRLEHLQKEQKDVDRLNSMTLSAFFYQLIGKKTERLEKEELELMESKAAYDTACRMLQDVQEQRIHVEQELEGGRQYQYWQSDYNALWGRRKVVCWTRMRNCNRWLRIGNIWRVSFRNWMKLSGRGIPALCP